MKLCTYINCNKKHYAKGYCTMHYNRQWRHGNPNQLMRVQADGRSRHPLWRTYNNMKQRCLNPDDTSYKDYGGRGITICDKWLGIEGFANFIADMGERPIGLTLDRRDNNKGYSPENCRWATYKQQRDNQRPYPKDRATYKNRTPIKRNAKGQIMRKGLS